MHDEDVREALQQHWAASDANDFEAEHVIYAEAAILEYPQSGERIRGRQHILASRIAQPNQKRFVLRRLAGTGGLWVSELTVTYDKNALFVVSLMDIEGGQVLREVQYFAEPFAPGASRVQLVEQMD